MRQGKRRQRIQYSISILVCEACGTEFPIPRSLNRNRETKHIKNLYCPNCRNVEKFVEYNNINRYYKNIDGDIISE